MTCREKLALEHPDCIDADCLGGCVECPSHYGYLEDSEDCPIKNKNEEESFLDLVDNLCDETCRKCWDREVKIDHKHILEIGKAIRMGFERGLEYSFYTSDVNHQIRNQFEHWLPKKK